MKHFPFIQPFIRSVFLLFVLFSINTTVNSQNNNFKTYGLSDGLSRSNVYSLKQDSRGYLWLGTNGGGVNKFDGTNFINYTIKDGFTGNNIRCIMEDSKGRMWFGTDGGITLYNGLDYQKITTSDSLKGSTVLSLLEDKHGTFWVGTDDGGVNKITITNNQEINVTNYNETDGLTSNTIFDIYEDKVGNIWLATLYGGINILNTTNDTIHVTALRGESELPSGLILSLAEDINGNVWCGTYDVGAFQIKASKGKPADWEVITYPEMSSDAIWDIHCRNNGEVWMATGDKGIVRIYFKEEQVQYVYYTTSEGVPINQLLCLEEDMEGNMWIGTNGEGVSKFTGDYFAHYDKMSGLSNDNITNIEKDDKDGMWLATDGGGLNYVVEDGVGKLQTTYFMEEQGLSSNYLTSLSLNKTSLNTNLWIGTTNKGIIKFDGKKFTTYTTEDGLLEDRINDIYVDGSGIVWVATSSGISKWDGEEFINVSMEDMMIKSDGVNCIAEDATNNIWIGTTGALAKYSRNGSLQTFDEEEGLKHTNVNCVTIDENGNPWIGTNGGGIYYFDLNSKETTPIQQVVNDRLLSSNIISSINFINDTTLIICTDKGMDKVTLSISGKVNTVKSYDVSDGFINIECNNNAMNRTDNELWIGTGSGLTRYDYTKEPKRTNPPLVHITAVQLFFKEVNWKERGNNMTPWLGLPKNIELPYTDNHLTYYFNGISTTNNEKIRYKYKLEGLDDEWSPTTSESKIRYPGLSPGNYIFRVMAVNADGIWSKEASSSFSISPAWYNTKTAYAAYIILILFGFILFIRLREKKLQKEKHVLEKKVADRTQDIREQKEEIEEQNHKIMDSINYAERIQSALLTDSGEWKKISEEHFVFFKPKDVVSGDFHWAFHNEAKNISIWVAADCTGHGVPGALMSMLGMSFLNEIVLESNVIAAAEILNQLRDKIIKTLEQKSIDTQQKDGMDLALCVWDKNKNVLEFSGANNPLWVIKDLDSITEEQKADKKTVINEKIKKAIVEYKANKQPIGLYLDEVKPFTSVALKMEKGDIIYTFSDGFPDQFGGPKGRKYMYKPFKKLLLDNYDKPLKEQGEFLIQSFNEWIGDLEQIDDVCVIGVQV